LLLAYYLLLGHYAYYYTLLLLLLLLRGRIIVHYTGLLGLGHNARHFVLVGLDLLAERGIVDVFVGGGADEWVEGAVAGGVHVQLEAFDFAAFFGGDVLLQKASLW
jgi:hypothetical protein